MLILIAPENNKFEMGTIVVTAAALALFKDDGDFLNASLARHAGGDWGDGFEREDWEANDAALKNKDDRILSVYKRGTKSLWIITEGGEEGCVTTLLLPEDY